jgi:hypothetical protein
MMAEAGATSALCRSSNIFSVPHHGTTIWTLPSQARQNKTSPTGAGEFPKQFILSPAAAGRDVLRLFHLRRC